MPSPEERDYGLAFDLAAGALAGRHAQEIARRSGAFVEEIRGRIFLELEVLGRRYVIPHPKVDVRCAESPEEVPLWTKVLILHYLERATGEPPGGSLVTFQEVESGAFMLPLYQERVVQPLMAAFGHRPAALVETAVSFFNGEERGHGDRSVTVLAFPYVPVTIVLWQGDEEFSPAGTLLYDATISQYLSTEDITSVSQMLIQALIRALPPEGG